MFWQKSYRLEWYLIIWHYLNSYVYRISFIARHFLLWKSTGAKFNFDSMFQQERNLWQLKVYRSQWLAQCANMSDIIDLYRFCRQDRKISRTLIGRSRKGGISLSYTYVWQHFGIRCHDVCGMWAVWRKNVE